MKSSTSYNPKQAFSCLVVGEPKTGKTNLIFAFPGLYVVDCDRNLSRAAKTVGAKEWFYDDPFVNDDGTPSDETQQWNLTCNRIKAAVKDPKVQTICIDGLAALSGMLLKHIVAEVKRTEGKALDRLRIQDYQPVIDLMTSLILGIRSTGKILLVTAHQVLDKDETTGRSSYLIDMPGRLSKKFGGLFSDSWGTGCSNVGGKIKYEIFTKPTGFHTALGTSRDLPATIDVTDKTPDQIWSIIGPKIEGK